MSWNGKRALITGASGALGQAIARRLAAGGATVLLHANSRPESGQALADDIVKAGGRATRPRGCRGRGRGAFACGGRCGPVAGPRETAGPGGAW